MAVNKIDISDCGFVKMPIVKVIIVEVIVYATLAAHRVQCTVYSVHYAGTIVILSTPCTAGDVSSMSRQGENLSGLVNSLYSLGTLFLC